MPRPDKDPATAAEIEAQYKKGDHVSEVERRETSKDAKKCWGFPDGEPCPNDALPDENLCASCDMAEEELVVAVEAGPPYGDGFHFPQLHVPPGCQLREIPCEETNAQGAYHRST